MNRQERMPQLQVIQIHETGAWQRRHAEIPSFDKEEMKKRINERVTNARNKLLEEEQSVEKSRLGFDLSLHTVVYQTLHNFKHDVTGAYDEESERINKGVKFDLETHIGERLNVSLSKFRYEIRGGRLYAAGGTEPVIEIFKRGRDYRKHHGSIDTAREDAEIDGMEFLEKETTNDNTPENTFYASASPRGREGSIYGHNFMDKFKKTKDEAGKLWVEVERILTTHSYAEFAERLSHFDNRYSADPESVPPDHYFLSNPVRIELGQNGINTDEDFLQFFHKDNEYMTYEEYQEVIKVCTPFVLDYIQYISEHPYDMKGIVDCYHAILNIADDVADRIQDRKQGIRLIRPVEEMVSAYRLTKDEWAQKPVRQASVGCGVSGGIGSMFGDAFSVADFGLVPDKYGGRTFTCPELHCRAVNIRPVDTLVEKCQSCGSARVSCGTTETKKKGTIIEFPQKEEKELQKAA